MGDTVTALSDRISALLHSTRLPSGPENASSPTVPFEVDLSCLDRREECGNLGREVDPIEEFTDDPTPQKRFQGGLLGDFFLWSAFASVHALLQGGGDESDAEIGRLVQRAAAAGVRYTSKQIRALLVIDGKLKTKIQSCDDKQQICEMLHAAGKRIGMVSLESDESKTKGTTALKPDKEAPPRVRNPEKGKSKGDAKGAADFNSKARNQGKPAAGLVEGPQRKGKGKGKSKDDADAPVFRSVRPIDRVDGIYLANDVKEVQHLVARSSDSSKNICFVMPRPFSIVQHTPTEQQIRLLKQTRGKQEIALLMGYLHVVSGKSPTTSRSAVPTIAQTVQRTSAIRVRISSQDDIFLSAIRARQTAAVRAWIASKLKHQIIDVGISGI